LTLCLIFSISLPYATPASHPPIAPQVPVLSIQPPEDGGWIHEIKH
jgi:hypothetical protein